VFYVTCASADGTLLVTDRARDGHTLSSGCMRGPWDWRMPNSPAVEPGCARRGYQQVAVVSAWAWLFAVRSPVEVTVNW
jgi:hypothetical protein